MTLSMFMVVLFCSVFAIVFAVEAKSQAKLSMVNLEILAESESMTDKDKGLKICICADIYSPDGNYDFRYMKKHCHVKTGLGCKDEYPCSKPGYSWVKCGTY